MKQKRILMAVLISIVLLCTAGLALAVPMGTAFTYRGFLMDKNQPAEGLYDFEFALYDANDLGYQQGSTINKDNVDLKQRQC